MLEQVFLNTAVNLKFFRRSRFILGLSLLVFLLMAISSVPMFIFGGVGGEFEVMRQVFDMLLDYVQVFAAIMGMFYIHSHIKDRSLKMVLTKPCLPETWLFSLGVSSALVVAGFHIVIFFAALGAFFVVGIQFQYGFLFLAAANLISSMILMFYGMFLATIIHPALAAVVIIFFSEGAFMGIFELVSSGLLARPDSRLLSSLQPFFELIYLALPMYEPFRDRYSDMMDSMTVSSDQWIYLVYSGAYALVFGTLMYLLSLYFLRRKNII
ncbi:MAG: hypothetical protein OEV92_02210 [Nitrospinota bacterium]|nr:hypothetical protein [Nitrospinota bacterium]